MKSRIENNYKIIIDISTFCQSIGWSVRPTSSNFIFKFLNKKNGVSRISQLTPMSTHATMQGIEGIDHFA
ncbi:MAG: hypothetical protein HOD60_13315 [Candidatus Nitrosopelagicus sp.]|nr:hypothetical protein [Candidatus Nitrosopelagicus sp.]